MAYILPSVLVRQEFISEQLASANPLRAHISGPNAQLFRFSDSGEKALSALGAYDPTQDVDYSYPNRPAGSLVDQSYFALYMEDALLRYFDDVVGSGGTQIPVSGYKNRIRSSTVSYRDHTAKGVTYSRTASLLRDVAVGDVVDVVGVVDSVTYTLRSLVQDVIGDTVAAVVDTAIGDDANQGDETAASSIGQITGPYNCVTAVEDGAAYDGAADGYISETYTIEVITGSTGGDHTTASLRVTSASGTDDEDDVTPSDAGSATAIGSRGLEVTFDIDAGAACSSSAEESDVSATDFLAGQKWIVTVAQDFTAPTATSGGTFSGDFDDSYIIEVTRGGAVGDATKPQITVTTLKGLDVSGPTTITAIDTAFTVGNYGVTVSFDASPLRKGDIYYIPVVEAHEGAMRTLVLANNMSDTLLTATDTHVTLYIKKDELLIPEQRAQTAPLVNYDLGDSGVADTGFTVKAGITVEESSWASGGTPVPLEVVEGDMFAQYRVWLSDLCNAIGSVADPGDLADESVIPGPLDPDNPLKWAVFKAASNSNGVDVRFTAVCDPDDVDSWLEVIDLLGDQEGIHGLVPLTWDATVLDAFVGHAIAVSAPEEGRRRTVWLTLKATETAALADDTSSTDGEEILATVEDDPDSPGSNFTIFDVPAGNANFDALGVRAGDTVRYNFTADGWGGETYDELTVDAVINEDSLRTVTGNAVAVSVAKKMEVWRTYSASELATQLATAAGTYGNRRVKAVWPDEVGSGGVTFEGWHMAAACAGLRSGVLPQQGLTNLEILGFDDVSRTTSLFRKLHLNTMAESGVYIVTQNDRGNIFARHALTTAGYGDVLLQEEMVTANVDYMSDVNQTSLADLIGVSNVTDGVMEIIDLRMEANISSFVQVRAPRLGGNLVSGEVLSVRRHATLKDRIVVTLRYIVPVPTNNIEVIEQIVA